jgi:hypothetical protein
MQESDLCADLRPWLEKAGLIVYPEVSDIDLVAVPNGATAGSFVRPEEDRLLRQEPRWEDTDCIAIQAKLAANCEVLEQAVWRSRGTSIRFVAVRRAGSAFIKIAHQLGVGVLIMEEAKLSWSTKGGTLWGRPALGWRLVPAPKRWPVKKPLELPRVVTDLPAGCASPSPLTKWRERALLICHILRTRGWVTSADFKEHGITTNYWLRAQLIKAEGKIPVAGASRPLHKFVMNPGQAHAMPDLGWEQIRDQLVAATPTLAHQLSYQNEKGILLAGDLPLCNIGEVPDSNTKEPR